MVGATGSMVPHLRRGVDGYYSRRSLWTALECDAARQRKMGRLARHRRLGVDDYWWSDGRQIRVDRAAEAKWTASHNCLHGQEPDRAGWALLLHRRLVGHRRYCTASNTHHPGDVGNSQLLQRVPVRSAPLEPDVESRDHVMSAVGRTECVAGCRAVARPA